jgi:phenylalanyl-tRNA synthetase beta chain
MLGDQTLGYLGVIDPKLIKQWKLIKPVVAAELSLPVLLQHSHLVPQQQLVSAFPSIQRDLNFVIAEKVQWSELEKVVRNAIGHELAGVVYRETYRDAKKDGADRKRVLLTVELQLYDSTLSGEQADALIAKVIGDCNKKLQAELLS